MVFHRIDAMITSEEALALDAQYQPFPNFSEWASTLSIDERTWQKLASRLEERKQAVSPEEFKQAIDFTMRAAAIDTGAIEGLYEVDRVFTYSVAIQAATWEIEAEERDLNIKRFFEAQLQTYELVLDAVTDQTPISEAWLRRLHEELCKPQDTYKVLTPAGLQDQPLPKGKYKKYPNHVKQPDGSTFSYAPVTETPAEMHRLMEELRTDAFLAAHPVLQASYAHYGLVKIHPFADGNGRVARVLASLYLYKVSSIPLVIFADQRDEYIKALNDSDNGRFQSFVDFIFNREVETFQIQLELLRLPTTPAPPVEESVLALNKLFTGNQSFRHQDLDDAAYSLVKIVKEEIQRKIKQIKLPPEVTFSINVDKHQYDVKDSSYRLPIEDEGRRIRITLNTAAPAWASLLAGFHIYIAKEPQEQGEILLKSLNLSQSFFAHLSDIKPKQTKAFEVRLAIWVERMLNEVFDQLNKLASEALHKSGYK